MSCSSTNIKFQLRRSTSALWNSTNPVLQAGEPGFDTTINRLKIGDGVTRWRLLPYLNDLDTGYTGPSSFGPTGTIQYSDGNGRFLGNTGFTYDPTGATNYSGTTSCALINVNGSILPTIDNEYSLGSTGSRFAHAYFGPNSISIGPSNLSYDGAFLFKTEDADLRLGVGGISVTNISSGVVTASISSAGVQFSGGNVGDPVVLIDSTGINITNSEGSVTTIQGPTGDTGYTGPTGDTGYTGYTGPAGPSIVFDGGNPCQNYSYGPVLDCGSVL